MNRQQKRAFEQMNNRKSNIITPKFGGANLYGNGLVTLTKDQLHEEVMKAIGEEAEKIRAQGIAYATERTLAIALISLNSEFEFGPKRLTDFLKRVMNNIDCVEAGTVTIEEIYEWCNSKGINFSSEDSDGGKSDM